MFAVMRVVKKRVGDEADDPNGKAASRARLQG